MEMIIFLGLDPETFHGDYAESCQYWKKTFEKVEIDRVWIKNEE